MARGLLPSRHPEPTAGAEALTVVTESLRAAYPGSQEADIILAPSGMNAFTAAWRSLAELQRARGRAVWIQLGWLYLDTMAVMKRFVGDPSHYVQLPNVTNLEALAAACEQAGDNLAGLVTETPTNPLVQTCDLAAVAQLVWNRGGRMLVDPTLVSPLNVDVLRYSDLVVNSLTKYAANEGDVLAGVVVVNPDREDAGYLRTHVARRTDPMYRRDLRRLAWQIDKYPALVQKTNVTCRQVARFLEQHPGVRDVYWPLRADGRANYLKIAKSEAHLGAVISFTVRGRMADFYDHLRLPKGPSFGMNTTLICPFIYLAHYDLVTTAEGRAELAAHGIDRDLLRLSVGAEPAEHIIAALREALDKAAEGLAP